MIAENRNGPVLARKVDDFATVRSAVHEIADEDQSIVAGRIDQGEQLSEFLVAAVNVADGNDTWIHQG